jgi:hypothetical protein
MNRLTDDRFAAALTLAVMIGSTAATGAALFGLDVRPAPAAHVGVVQMPAVEVTGRRDATAGKPPVQIASASAVVHLPKITITGRRPPAVVAAASAQRISTSTNGQNCVETAPPAAAGMRT